MARVGNLLSVFTRSTFYGFPRMVYWKVTYMLLSILQKSDRDNSCNVIGRHSRVFYHSSYRSFGTYTCWNKHDYIILPHRVVGCSHWTLSAGSGSFFSSPFICGGSRLDSFKCTDYQSVRFSWLMSYRLGHYLVPFQQLWEGQHCFELKVLCSPHYVW